MAKLENVVWAKPRQEIPKDCVFIFASRPHPGKQQLAFFPAFSPNETSDRDGTIRRVLYSKTQYMRGLQTISVCYFVNILRKSEFRPSLNRRVVGDYDHNLLRIVFASASTWEC